MPRHRAIRDVMTTDVLYFRPDDDVGQAMQQLLDRDVDGAPVVDEGNKVVGVITTGDLIVKESRLHFPTVIAVFGAPLQIQSPHFEDDLNKALGSKVRDVMSSPAISVEVDGTVEDAAPLMHDKRVARLPVVDQDDRLVGIVSRVDVLRGIIAPD